MLVIVVQTAYVLVQTQNVQSFTGTKSLLHSAQVLLCSFGCSIYMQSNWQLE